MMKYLGAAAFAVTLITSVAVPSLRAEDKRYYDKEHKDYHQWNESEEKTYHQYWEEQKHPYVDWNHAKAEQRAAYWKWRHEHPDTH